MFLLDWKRWWKSQPQIALPSRSQDSSTKAGRFCPRLECLEDRTVLTGPYPYLPPLPAAPVTSLQVIVPSSVQAGVPAAVEVIALNASNLPAYTYTGTVHFTSSDGAATSPANYTFTAQDHGVHFFQETFNTTGSQTLTVTDTAAATITGSATTTVDPAPVATHVLVIAPPSLLAGIAAPVEVVVLDASNHLATNYTGTVHFTSSDSTATLPANYTFTSSDHGVHFFQVTLNTQGSQTITATDTTTTSLTGTATTTVNPAPVATHFLVLAPDNVQPGVATQVEVVALDASNHLAYNYTGTVQFSSSDSSASLPVNYTFTTSNQGIASVDVTWQTADSQTITATDTTNSGLNGSATVQVATTPTSNNAATHLLVIAPSVVDLGLAFPVKVFALDAANHLAVGYTGTVQLSSSDNAATLPPAYTFTAQNYGIHFFTVTLATQGTQTITVTDTTTATITGSVTTSVDPAPVATHLLVIAPAGVLAGTAFPVEVVALDASDHLAYNYTGTVEITSSDGAATLPANYTFTAANHGLAFVEVTLNTQASQTITATDTTTASITGSVTTTVNPAPVATHFLVLASPNVEPGVAAPIEIIALDASNHLAYTYTGTVHFTSSDNAATLPANFTFTSANNGVYASTVTMQTAGSQTITATDTVTASITGTAITDVDTTAAPTASQLAYVANELTHSNEFYSNFVINAYHTYLGRNPAAAEISGWVQLMDNGMSEAGVEAGFIGSTEYINDHGGPGASWVISLYQNLLGRTPAASEVAGWVFDLGRGMSTTSIAYSFAGSFERETERIGSFYTTFLGRTASAAEIDGWATDVMNGASNDAVIAGFVSSTEFFNDHSTDASAWLYATYEDILGRPADQNAFASWLPVL
jgi:hypothetical protein